MEYRTDKTMNVIKVVKKIDSNHIHVEGLDNFKGKSAEIIILIEDAATEDLKTRRDKALKMVNSYSGSVKKWTRDELYDR